MATKENLERIQPTRSAKIVEALIWSMAAILVVLMIKLVTDIRHRQAREVAALNNGRTLTPAENIQLGDYNLLTFVETDTVIIYEHRPDGWFTPDMKLRKLEYGFTGHTFNGITYAVTRYTLVDKQGHRESHITYDRLFSGRALMKQFASLSQRKP